LIGIIIKSIFFFFIAGLIYNVVEGLLPDKNFPINIISQNIIGWTVGVGVAYYYILFIKKEYDLVFLKAFSLNNISIAVLIFLVCLFVIPYTASQSLNLSRNLFLSFIMVVLLSLMRSIVEQQYSKFKKSDNQYLKLYNINGILGMLFLFSLPMVIIICGDNQLIEQTSFSFGFFVLSIDYFFCNYRPKKEQQNKILIENLTPREKEILLIILTNPKMKYIEVGDMLNISEKTISVHMTSVFKKIGVKSKKNLSVIDKSIIEHL
jgi:DNA-binding CsgD family transcriptional regulator